MEPRRLQRRGSGLATFSRSPLRKLVLPCHSWVAVVQSALWAAWRSPAKPSSVSGFAADVRRCSGSVSTVTADITIAAPLAAFQPGSSSVAPPIAATSRARRDAATIATGNAPIGVDTARKQKP